MSNLISRSADFFIKMTMMMTTAVVLAYFGFSQQNIALIVLFFLYILAIIMKGASDIFLNKQNE